MYASWRPRWIVVTTGVVIALIALGVVALVRGFHGGAAAPAADVPYSDTTFQPATRPQPFEPAADSIAGCVSTELVVVEVKRNAFPDSDGRVSAVGIIMTLVNEGTVCALQGAPLVTLSGSTAPEDVVTAEFSPTSDDGVPKNVRWTVRPGDQIGVGIGVAGEPCTRFPDSTWILTVDGGPELRYTAEVPAPGCNVPDSSGDRKAGLAWQPKPAAAPAPLTPLDEGINTLTVTIDVPGQVPFGQAFEFTVALANPTKATVSLEPCPRYLQAIGEGAFVADHYGVLNCTGAPTSIAAGQTIRFRMLGELPKQFTAGSGGSVHWAMFLEGNPFDATGPGSISDEFVVT